VRPRMLKRKGWPGGTARIGNAGFTERRIFQVRRSIRVLRELGLRQWLYEKKRTAIALEFTFNRRRL